MKRTNQYATEISFYDRCPKAVFAAIAVSALTVGGGLLGEADRRVLDEWWALYEAGIVPQKPNIPRPHRPDAYD